MIILDALYYIIWEELLITMSFIKKIFFLAFFSLTLFIQITPVQAAETFSITYIDSDGNQLTKQDVTAGSALGTLPSVDDLFLWISQNGTIVTETTIPTEAMQVQAISNSSVTASGTMDNGNVTWFLLNDHLYVTGNGTIGPIAGYYSSGSTKKYGLSLGEISVAQPSLLPEWQSAPTVGDELTGGYENISIPAETTRTISLGISRPVSFSGQKIGYPHSTQNNYIPWLEYADNIKEMTFSPTVKLEGNFTLYFNANSSSVIPGKISESVYSKLETIYLYADTSKVEQMGGMFARIPNLKNIYTLENETFDTSSCWDISSMFYGDKNLTCDPSDGLVSIINVFSDTSHIEDTMYTFFGCESLSHPEIGNWDMSSNKDASYMFTGCVNLELTLCGNNSSTDLGAWDTSNIFSTTGMFAGSNIDITADDPMGNLWGAATSSVITGDINLDLWDLSSLKVSVFMFAQNHSISSVTWTSAAPLLSDASAMFAFCDGISSINFKNLNVNSLRYSDAMFFCAGYQDSSASFSGIDFSSLEEARYMFYGTNFTSIDLDNTNPQKMTISQGMFSNNTALTSLGTSALSSWTLTLLVDGSYMFNGCPLLAEINTQNWNMSSVTDINHMFSDDVSLTSLSLNDWEIGGALENMDCFLYGCSNIGTIDISKWTGNALKSAYHAFANMSSLKSVAADKLSWAGMDNANGLFANDYVLISVSLSGDTASKLSDAGGLFYNCAMLSELNSMINISAACENVSYFFSGCSSLSALDLSNWNTTSVIYFQGMCDGMSALETLTVGGKFTTISATSTAAMLRNCSNLSNVSLQKIINRWNPSNTIDAYEMFYNTGNLIAADISAKDFSNCTNITRMFYNNNNLESITLSNSFGSLCSSDSAQNVFWVEDDTLTALKIVTDNEGVSSFLKAYDWKNDNRRFLILNGSYINGKSGNTYTFTDTNSASVALKVEVASTLYIDDTAATINYSWSNGSEVLSNATSSELSIDKGTTGTFYATCTLSELDNAATLSTTYNVSKSSGLSGISAVYSGGKIVVGESYSLDDLTVTLTGTDGTSTTLSSSDYSVNSQTVSIRGKNTFYVFYTDLDGVLWSDTFTVTGYREIASISATYTGKSVIVGNKYNKDNVIVTAYYSDDTAKKKGVIVTPSSFDSQTVSSEGTNTFTATYIDTANSNASYSATFTVTGYTQKNISSISASYGGSSVTVGQCFDRDSVTVTLNYSDGTTGTTTDFTLDSTLVQTEGNNSFTATVMDTDGTLFTATFNVVGVTTSNNSGKSIASISAVYNGSKIRVGSQYSKDDVAVTINYSDGSTFSTSDFTLNSTSVTVAGDNTFTAMVTDSSGTTFSAYFTVPGWLLTNVAYIDASYSGPTILLGNTYDLSNVTVTIHFADGSSDMTTTDFTVNSTTVTSSGDNTFTAYVTDSNGSQWADDFVVRGTSDASEAAASALNYSSALLGVQTGDSNSIAGLIMCLSGLVILLAILLYIKFIKKNDDERGVIK